MAEGLKLTVLVQNRIVQEFVAGADLAELVS